MVKKVTLLILTVLIGVIAAAPCLPVGWFHWPHKAEAASYLISGFEPGHSWAKAAGTFGTWSDDPTKYTEGTQSYQVVTDGAAGDSKARWTSISPAKDLTDRFLVMDVYIDDVANLNRLWLYAFSTAWTAGYTWKPSDAPSHYIQGNAQWLTISMSFTQVAVTGAPVRSSIVALQLYVQDKNSTAVTVNFDNLRMTDKAASGVVSYTFDDGWLSQYSEAYTYMHGTYDMRATLYASYDVIGTDPTKYLEVADLTDMHDDGWEIAGHYSTNLDEVGDVDQVVSDGKDWLDTNGFWGDGCDFAYPGGVWSASIIDVVDDYFSSGRTIIPYSETLPAAALFRLRVLEVFDTTPLATIETAIDNAVTNSDWLILVFHKIVAVPGASIEYATADFEDAVDYTDASGIGVKTVREVLATGAPMVTVTTPTSVEGTIAALNGELTSDGGDPCNVTLYWGTTNGGTDPGSWANNGVPTYPAQPMSAATFYKCINSLTTATTYYVTARAANSYGATWATVISFKTGNVFYCDYESGADATTATPFGWWSVAYTSGSGAQPEQDQTATGGSSGSTAKVTVCTVSSGTWAGGNAAGTLYWYGKSAAFAAETLTFSPTSATCSIAADFTYCAWKTITSGATSARIAPGDTIREAKSPDPYSVGNATWTTGSATITLASAQNLNLDMCETAWTAVTGIISTVAAAPTAGGLGYSVNDVLTITTGGSGGTVTVQTVDGSGTVLTVALTTRGRTYTTGAGKVTTGGTGDGNCTINITAVVDASVTRNAIATDGKEGSYSMQVTAPATSVTNACYAYYNIADADYSSYEKLTFWFKNEVACLSTWWRIYLCSDDAGETVVDTITIPAIPSAATWVPFTIARDGGGSLANPVKSIALWTGSVAPTASKYVRFDDFLAATTGGLNLQSLVSTNSHAQCQTDEDGFYNLKSINGTTLVYASGYGGWAWTTTTVTTYARETTKTALVAAGGNVQKAQDSGTAASVILFQGGWDKTINTVNGETYFDGLTVLGNGLHNDYQDYNRFEHISMVRYGNGFCFDQSNAAYFTVVEADEFVGCNYGYYQGNSNTYNALTRVYNVLCCNRGIDLETSYFTLTKADNILNCVNGFWGMSGNNPGIVIVDIDNILRCSGGISVGETNAHVYNIDTIEYCSLGLSLNTSNNLGVTIDNIGKISHNTAAGVFFNWARGVYIGNIGECHYNGIGIAYSAAAKCVINHIGNLDYNTTYAVDFSNTSQAYGNHQNLINLIDTMNNNGVGVNFYYTGNYSATKNHIGQITQANNSGTYAVRWGYDNVDCVVGSISTSGSGTAPFRLEGIIGQNYVLRATCAEATKVSATTQHWMGNLYVGWSDGNWSVYTYGVTAVTQTGTIHGATGMAVKVNPTTSDRAEYYGLALPVGTVHCTANDNHTVSLWVKKDHATNVGCRIYCEGGQVAGVVYTTTLKASDINWEQLSLALTPTADGDVTIWFDSWYVAGSSYTYCDLTPTITSGGSSLVEEESASLTATVGYPVLPFNMGFGFGVQPIGINTRGFEYDTDSGAPYASDWHEHGVNLAGASIASISGLDEGTLYYYRAYETDAWATYYTAEGTFLTKPDEPSGFSATSVSDSEIDLAWTKGDGADNTVIRGKIGSYPVSVSDGVEVYNDSGNSCAHSGLSTGEHWYYRAWSYATDGGLSQYSDVSVMDGAITGLPVAAPAVTTSAAVAVEETTAILVGDVTDAGNLDVTTRGFEYDTDSGAPYANDWHEHGTFGEGLYTGAVSSLSEGTLYYYRAYATNTEGTTYGSEETFLSKPDEPTGFTATATTAILYTLDWVKGTGAQTTVVRGKVGSFPTDVSDGTLIYNGPLATCTHDVAGEHWYYRAWSYATDGGLSQYSDETGMDSCVPGGGLPAVPDAPTDFTAVMSSDNMSVSLTWTIGAGADYTQIQASLSDYPANPGEGDTVYFGPSDNYTDSLDWDMATSGTTVYYSAWSINAGGYSANHAEATTAGGKAMTNALILIPMILLLGGLTYIGESRRNWLVILIAGFGWFLFAGWCMLTSAASWDAFFIFAILGAMIALVTFIWPLVTRPKELPKDEDESEESKAWGGRPPKRPTGWRG